jgi:CD109 antigen
LGFSQLPYGCGEQNMINFVPNIVVLDYLTNLNKLTPQIESKAIKFMETGYQRELTFKHDDGSYSAFGKSDKSGSTWLTAFVVKSFIKASKYIFIDDNLLIQSLSFLQNTQQIDGSFVEVGQVHNSQLQGGSSAQGIALTAYVMSAFLENEIFSQNYSTTISKAVDFIAAQINSSDNVYELSLATYALQKANSPLSKKFLDKLNLYAVNTQGMKYWKKSNDEKSMNVESTAYAFMAFLNTERTSDYLPILKWLISQKNKFGGFYSTQDTFVGLEALSKMATRMSSDKNDIQVELSFLNQTKLIEISPENALIVQTIQLPSNLNSVIVKATGSGFCILQISHRFNIIEPNSTIIKLESSITGNSNNTYFLTTCAFIDENLHLKETNMVVLNIKSISGYSFESNEKHTILNSSSLIKVNVALKNF